MTFIRGDKCDATKTIRNTKISRSKEFILSDKSISSVCKAVYMQQNYKRNNVMASDDS